MVVASSSVERREVGQIFIALHSLESATIIGRTLLSSSRLSTVGRPSAGSSPARLPAAATALLPLFGGDMAARRNKGGAGPDRKGASLLEKEGVVDGRVVR